MRPTDCLAVTCWKEADTQNILTIEPNPLSKVMSRIFGAAKKTAGPKRAVDCWALVEWMLGVLVHSLKLLPAKSCASAPPQKQDGP